MICYLRDERLSLDVSVPSVDSYSSVDRQLRWFCAEEIVLIRKSGEALVQTAQGGGGVTVGVMWRGGTEGYGQWVGWGCLWGC